MFKHLLFPSDFSPAAELAFAQALELAVRLQAKLTLLHVIRPHDLVMSSPHGIYDHQIARQFEAQQLELAETRLGLYTQQISERHLASDLLVVSGYPGEAIVATAQARGCDAIVMGSRGYGPIRSVLLGSTSTYVLHHSSCPVMVLPLGKPQTPLSEPSAEAHAGPAPQSQQPQSQQLQSLQPQRLDLDPEAPGAGEAYAGPSNPDAPELTDLPGITELPAGAETQTILALSHRARQG